MAPYNREPNPAGVALANAMFFWIFILYVFFPCLLCYSLVGVILYMYSKYRTIQDEKEGVMQLQQNYLIQKSNSKVKL